MEDFIRPADELDISLGQQRTMERRREGNAVVSTVFLKDSSNDNIKYGCEETQKGQIGGYGSEQRKRKYTPELCKSGPLTLCSL